VEGVVRVLSKRIKELRGRIPDYTTVWERAIKIPPSIDKTIDDYVDGVIIVVDSTGLKVYDRGEWVRELYGPKVWRKRGFIKMHVSFDKEISYRVGEIRGVEEG